MAARLTPWFSRFVLLATTLILGLISRKFITDPVGAAAASGISLDTPLAITNMRASFGAFPLGCAVLIAACAISARRHLAGLYIGATILGIALLVRIYGVMIDGTLADSLRVLTAESIFLALNVLAILFMQPRERTNDTGRRLGERGAI